MNWYELTLDDNKRWFLVENLYKAAGFKWIISVIVLVYNQI